MVNKKGVFFFIFLIAAVSGLIIIEWIWFDKQLIFIDTWTRVTEKLKIEMKKYRTIEKFYQAKSLGCRRENDEFSRKNAQLTQKISYQQMKYDSLLELDIKHYNHPSLSQVPYFSIKDYFLGTPVIKQDEPLNYVIWKDYVEFHQKSLLKLNLNINSFPILSNSSYFPSVKFLVFRPTSSGWGNRIQVLSAAFQLALITERVFLVDWTLPCNISELVQEPDIRWHLDQVLALNPLWNLSYHASHLEFDFSNEEQVRKFFSKALIKEALNPWQFVVIEHWQTFEVPLFQNPAYSKFLNSFFGSNTIKTTIQLLIKPHKEIQKEIDAFKKNHELEGKQVIALQIRRGTKETSFVEIADLKMEEKFWICAKKYAASKDTKFFLATDDHNTRQRAKLPENLGDRVIFADKPIVHSGMQQDVDTKGNKRTLEGLRAVVFDFWMLGEFDKILITDYSSFSRVAAQRTEKNVEIISERTNCELDKL